MFHFFADSAHHEESNAYVKVKKQNIPGRNQNAGIHHHRIAEKVLRNDDEKNADRAGSRPATAVRGKKR